ncbi:hypothetical protein WA026_003502 [Henosepilachna vigintioctopunctata]|uniref:Uncharacterized protein n=1 Tax=Henosepilachna vigintioctopunctata TaxID=420089 RepID=A0AAW1TJ45_9CUCU
MFSTLIICNLMVLTLGRPQDPNEVNSRALLANSQKPQYNSKPQTNATIVNQTDETNADGSFNFSFETSDGVRVQQNGFLKKLEAASKNAEEGDGFVQVLMGSYSYTAPNGEVIQLQYVADENGYQPQGTHIPTIPPNQLNAARALEQINNTPQQYDQEENVQSSSPQPPQRPPQPPQGPQQIVSQGNAANP